MDRYMSQRRQVTRAARTTRLAVVVRHCVISDTVAVNSGAIQRLSLLTPTLGTARRVFP